MEHAAPEHEKPRSVLKTLALGTALVTGAVIVSPYLLSALGYGSSDLIIESMSALHGTGAGTGIAGFINSGISKLPLVGEVIAKGGIASAVATGVTGVGGMLLGRFLEKKQDGTQGINWGKVIKYAALATTAMLALPSILTGVSVGVVYMFAAFSGDVALSGAAALIMARTLGSIGAMNLATAGTGLISALPHILTCGASILPAAFSFKMFHKDGSSERYQSSPEVVLDAETPDVRVSIEPVTPVVAGQPCAAKVRLSYADGTPLTEDGLATTHTRKLHVMIVDDSLKDYHHLHPRATEEPGVFVCEFTPNTGNRYTAWADFTLQHNGQNYTLQAPLPSANARSATPRIQFNSVAEAANLKFEWRAQGGLQKGVSGIVEVHVTDAQGRPVTDLEPVMGAAGHLVGFGADGKTFIHTHPLSEVTEGATNGPVLRFHVTPESDGPIQFYLQVQRRGQEVYVPFGQQVKAPVMAAERVSAPHRQHAPGAFSYSY